MKNKLILLVLWVVSFESINAQSSNPIVQRLSNQEIAECKTPAAVAYSFTIAILQKDFDKMLSYIDFTPNEAQEIEEYLQESRETYETLYSQNKDVVALWSWLPALGNGFEIAIADMEDIWLAKTDYGWTIHPDQIVKDGMVYIPGEKNPYVGIHEKRVYVTCSPSSEINSFTFNDITRYEDSQVEVVLRQNEEKWVVDNFYFMSQFKKKILEGTWYLQEVKIPLNEEYIDGIQYDKNQCIVFKEEGLEEVEIVEDVDALNYVFESYKEAAVSSEEDDKTLLNEKTNSNIVDTIEYNNLIRELYLLSGVEYEIVNDSILVMYCPQKETYLIKKITKDLLMLAIDDTPQGCIVYVYGRKEQPIRHTKYNYITTDNDKNGRN